LSGVGELALLLVVADVELGDCSSALVITIPLAFADVEA
jgi:hypothetical protein